VISTERFIVQVVVAISWYKRPMRIGAEPRAMRVENVFVFPRSMLVISPDVNA
jgi:hypothetical protein